MGTRARSSVQFKGQSVFVEAEARRSSFYRSGDLAKYLQRLGCKIEEFQTSQGIVADFCCTIMSRVMCNIFSVTKKFAENPTLKTGG